jgi:putative hydrolase of the HAD superfamily
MVARKPVWLFDLDNTLHNASHASFEPMTRAMSEYIERQLALSTEEANALRRRYFDRYGATLLGLVRHHGVDTAHFLHETHLLPGLEARVQGHRHDLAALRGLPGRKLLLTNAPLHYTRRVLGVLGIARYFDAVISIEDMHMFGELRPKPDARMLRRLAARLRVPPSRCVLVEDSLENQKAARRIGMRTVWMQRWTRQATWGAAASARVSMVPAYVDLRVSRIAALQRRPFGSP